MYQDKMMGKRVILLLTTLAYFWTGCAEKWEPKPLTVTQLIAGTEKKVWKFHSIEIIDEGEVEGPISVNEIYLPCARDNEYVFYNNEEKTFEYTSGAIKCTNDEPEVLLDYFWSYTTANATFEFPLPLELFGAIYILPFTVKKLTDTEMVLEVYFSKIFVDEIDASYRITLKTA